MDIHIIYDFIVQLYFSSPLGSSVPWFVCCLHLKIELRSCASGASMMWHLSL